LKPPTRSFGPVTQTDIVRFAGAGGDFNPLHHDPAVAARAGFPQPIAMGQFSAALVGAWLTDWYGPENLLSFEVRFTSPLHIGDTLEVGGEVADYVHTDDGLCLATLALAATSDDRVIVTGSARAIVDCARV
jgi:3-hydroxybutyryl-CoA dehydratase